MTDDVNDGKRDFLRTRRGARRGRRHARQRARAARGDGADARDRHPRGLEPREDPQGRRDARRLLADRPVVLQGREDRRARRHLQGRGRAARQGDGGEGRLEGSHLPELDGRPAQGRLRPLRLVAHVHDRARRGRRLRRAAVGEGQPADGAQGQRRPLQEARRLRRSEGHVLGRRRRQRGAAHPDPVPEGEAHHHRGPGRARRRAGARQARRRVDERRQRRAALRQAQQLGARVRPERADRQAARTPGPCATATPSGSISSTCTARSSSSTARWSGCSSCTWRSWARPEAPMPR